MKTYLVLASGGWYAACNPDRGPLLRARDLESLHTGSTPYTKQGTIIQTKRLQLLNQYISQITGVSLMLWLSLSPSLLSLSIYMYIYTFFYRSIHSCMSISGMSRGSPDLSSPGLRCLSTPWRPLAASSPPPTSAVDLAG